MTTASHPQDLPVRADDGTNVVFNRIYYRVGDGGVGFVDVKRTQMMTIPKAKYDFSIDPVAVCACCSGTPPVSVGGGGDVEHGRCGGR